MDEKAGLGIIVGIGMTLVLLGFFGWFHTSYSLEKLRYIFKLVGIDASRHYLIADLNKLMRIYAGFIVMGVVTLLFGSLGIKMKVKSDTINLGMSLVLGSTLAFLGLINWIESSLYAPGLMFVLMSISFTKYKAYAKYYAPPILICGIIVTILGIQLVYATHCGETSMLVYETGLGVIGGGVVNLILPLKQNKK